MITIGILGYGYWGPNLMRNFAGLNCRVKRVVDFSIKRQEAVKAQYPDIIASGDCDDVFNDNEINAVVIALPVSYHYSMAKRALETGKHVLVEKPMTDSVEDAAELIELAEKNKLVLMVDHTFLYTGAVKAIKALIDAGELGTLHYFDSTRINLGLFRTDINVVWDLAPHDISILKYITNKQPVSVVATGQTHTSIGLENISYITLFYNADFIAHLNVSWVSPVKLRNVLIGGEKKMVLYDDTEPTEKLRIYDTGYSVMENQDTNALRVDYRIGDIYIPKLDTSEALKEMAIDFLHCIECGCKPVSNANLSFDVVKTLVAVQKSLKSKGKEMYL